MEDDPAVGLQETVDGAWVDVGRTLGRLHHTTPDKQTKTDILYWILSYTTSDTHTNILYYGTLNPIEY